MSDEQPQSLIGIADCFWATLIGCAIWFGVGAAAMIIGLLWMCG